MQRQFIFRPSRILAIMLAVAHITAMLALLALAMPFWAITALLLLFLCSLQHYLRRDAWLSASSSASMCVLDEEGVILTRRSGQQFTGRLSHSSLITPFLTVLNVLPQGAFLARSVVILPDSLDRESYRQLRVWLKWG